MRNTAPLLFCVYGLLCFAASAPAHAADEAVIADPPVVSPGQTVKLRWYFTGSKVTIVGGRFTTATAVTGKTMLADTPHKTTKYTFDVYYNGTETNAAGERVTAPLHQRYFVTAFVDTTPLERLTSYRDPHGWKIDYLAEWKRDVSTPDTGASGLIFFQKEYDSLERMAVAVLPAKDKTIDDLVKKVISDVPSGYTEPKIEPDTAITVGDTPARSLIFSGGDMSHPGTRTKSEVLVMLRDGRGYFVSIRCPASQFDLRARHLERMLKSFGFTSPSTQKSAGSGAKTAAAVGSKPV